MAAAQQCNVSGSLAAAQWQRQRQRRWRQCASAILVVPWWRRSDGNSGSGGSTTGNGNRRCNGTQHKLCISSCASARAILYSNIVRRAMTTAMKMLNVDDKASCASARQFHITSRNSDDDKDYWRRQRTSVGRRGMRPHAQEHNIFTASCGGMTTIVASSWKKSTNHYNETRGNKVNNQLL